MVSISFLQKKKKGAQCSLSDLLQDLFQDLFIYFWGFPVHEVMLS